jgi:hypothetical protein
MMAPAAPTREIGFSISTCWLYVRDLHGVAGQRLAQGIVDRLTRSHGAVAGVAAAHGDLAGVAGRMGGAAQQADGGNGGDHYGRDRDSVDLQFDFG